MLGVGVEHYWNSTAGFYSIVLMYLTFTLTTYTYIHAYMLASPNFPRSWTEIADTAAAGRHCSELLPPGPQAGPGRVPPVQCWGHHEV